jgi:hypothetical protein
MCQAVSITTSIDDHKQWIEEDFCGLLKRNTVVVYRVDPGFFFIPDKRDAIENEIHIHACSVARAYLHCQYTLIATMGSVQSLLVLNKGDLSTVPSKD